MSKTRSEILQAARRAGNAWAWGTPQSTKDRLKVTNTYLWSTLEELGRLTTRGETSHDSSGR